MTCHYRNLLSFIKLTSSPITHNNQPKSDSGNTLEAVKNKILKRKSDIEARRSQANRNKLLCFIISI